MDPYTLSDVDRAEEDPTIEGDTVIVSSLEDKAHSNIKIVRGTPRVINALDVAVHNGQIQVDGSPIIAVGAAESPIHDSGSPKDNALYALQVGGVWIMHMGDLGYGLTAEELNPFVGRCDLLLAIVGEYNTVSLEDLDLMIDRLQPRWIVPMHYLIWFPSKMRPVTDFIKRRPNDPVIYARSSTVRFPMEINGTRHPAIVVLEPSGCPPQLKQTLRLRQQGRDA
jgi:L-ascorbate metabolism protein UlaG (beta-lactamase superfamily)